MKMLFATLGVIAAMALGPPLAMAASQGTIDNVIILSLDDSTGIDAGIYLVGDGADIDSATDVVKRLGSRVDYADARGLLPLLCPAPLVFDSGGGGEGGGDKPDGTGGDKPSDSILGRDCGFYPRE